MAPFERLVEPAGYHLSLKVRVQHDALLGPVGRRLPVQVQVVVGDAAVPISTGRRPRNVVHRLQHERDRAAGLHRRHEVGFGQAVLAGAKVGGSKGQRTMAGKHHPLQPCPKRRPCHGIAQVRARIAQRRAQRVLALQHMAPAGGHHMQAVTRVLQHLGHAPAIERLKAVSKLAADLLGRHPLLAGRQFVVLVDVVVLEPLKGGHRFIQAGRGHAPGANRCAHQMHRPARLGQPLPKNEPVQWSKNQALGATGSRRNDTDVLGFEPMFTNMRLGLGAGMDVERLHARYCVGGRPAAESASQALDGIRAQGRAPTVSDQRLMPCSLANAEAIALWPTGSLWRCGARCPRPAPSNLLSRGPRSPLWRAGAASVRMLRLMRLRAMSTSSTLTLTMSPVLTTARASLTNLLASWLTCTRPSWCTPRSTKAPNWATLDTVPSSTMPSFRSLMSSTPSLKRATWKSGRGSRPGFSSSPRMSLMVMAPNCSLANCSGLRALSTSARPITSSMGLAVLTRICSTTG